MHSIVSKQFEFRQFWVIFATAKGLRAVTEHFTYDTYHTQC